MDPRLEEASYNGDLDALFRLLQEDRFLLERLRLSTASCVPNNPLHIAALLGHTDFARAILHLKPGLARDSNGHGSSPLHLAAANGHLPIVRELVRSKSGTGLCLLRDENGLLPIHTAAIEGRVRVLAELLDACSESARLRTSQEDTVLHLAVHANCSQVVEFLVERFDDGEFLNAKDAEGNTILHLAMARRQLQIVKFLLSKTRIHVNSVNSWGFTPLDALLESPREHDEDSILAEMIRAAGGKTTAREEARRAPERDYTSARDRSTWTPLFGLTSSLNERLWTDGENAEGILMVVATLIATITSQGGPPRPPGGFAKFDAVGLFASLGVILPLMCAVAARRKRKVMKFLVSIMWASVFPAASAFSMAMFQILPESVHPTVLILLNGWLWVFRIAVVWVALRLSVCSLRKAGWFQLKEEEDRGRNGAKGIAAALVVIAVIFACMVKFPTCVPTPAAPDAAAAASESFYAMNCSISYPMLDSADDGIWTEKKPETPRLAFPGPHPASSSDEDSGTCGIDEGDVPRYGSHLSVCQCPRGGVIPREPPSVVGSPAGLRPPSP